MTPADRALETVIADITRALQCCPDPRLAKLQQQAIAMRSAEQVAHMERAKGLAPNQFFRSRRHG